MQCSRNLELFEAERYHTASLRQTQGSILLLATGSCTLTRTACRLCNIDEGSQNLAINHLNTHSAHLSPVPDYENETNRNFWKHVLYNL